MVFQGSLNNREATEGCWVIKVKIISARKGLGVLDKRKTTESKKERQPRFKFEIACFKKNLVVEVRREETSIEMKLSQGSSHLRRDSIEECLRFLNYPNHLHVLAKEIQSGLISEEDENFTSNRKDS